jgi:hypothetical protein
MQMITAFQDTQRVDRRRCRKQALASPRMATQNKSLVKCHRFTDLKEQKEQMQRQLLAPISFLG